MWPGLTRHGTKGYRQQVGGCRMPELLEFKIQGQRKPPREPDQTTHMVAATQVPWSSILHLALENHRSTLSQKKGQSSPLPALPPPPDHADHLAARLPCWDGPEPAG